MKNILKIFEIDNYSRSYKFGAIRVGISALILIAVCLFRFSVTIPDLLTNVISTLVLLAVMILSIIVMFIGAAECLQVSQNIKTDKGGK